MENNNETQETYVPDPDKPLAYTIYKGVSGKFGVVRFEFIPPFSNPKRRKADGTVLVTAANAIGPNQYDWDNKIVFALSISDIGAVMEGLRKGEINLFHDPGMKSETQGAVTKSLKMIRGEGKESFFFSLSSKQNGTESSVKLPISVQEAMILNVLLSHAVPKMLNW